MRLIFIGTSSGRTSLSRFHSSILISNDSQQILIDAGDGISKALLNQGISFNSVSDIVFSHYHSDHLAGLPSLLTQMIIENREEDLNLFTHNKLVKPLNEFLNISYIFPEKLNFNINIKPFDHEEYVHLGKGVSFLARRNSHVTNKHSILNDQISFLSSGFLLKLGDHNIFYSSDIGSEKDLFLFNDQNPEITIAEATHIPLSFFSDSEERFTSKKIYLIHIDDEQALNNWYSNLPGKLQEKIIITEDGMTLEI